MTTTAGHSFYIGPIGSFYNQVNDTGSSEPLGFFFALLKGKKKRMFDVKLCDSCHQDCYRMYKHEFYHPYNVSEFEVFILY